MKNAFVALCRFGDDIQEMAFRTCNLFKRSFTDKGIGFTFNNEIENKLIKTDFHSTAFNPNTDRSPSLIKSAASKHALRVVIENNAEEVERYMKDDTNNRLEPTEISISLHNPKEPADLRERSFNIPLGYKTKVYITPKARIIDDSGRRLTESQRNCRLDEDTESLEIYNIYTRAACMLECKIRHSLRKCGCLPWNYPHPSKSNVSS